MRLKLLELTRELFQRIRLPYRSTLAGFVVKAIGPRNRSVTGSIGAYEITFDLNDGIQRQVFFGIYDPAVTRAISRMLGPGDVFVDVGANIGYFSFVASQIVGDSGGVHAFEPIPLNVSRIRDGIRENGITNIKLNPTALGSQKGQLKLYAASAPSHYGGATLVRGSDRPVAQMVDMITLDDYVREESLDRVRLVKVDIEGAEYDALIGMGYLLSQSEAPDLICEIHPYLLGRQNLSPSDVTDYLIDLGYSVFIMNGSTFRPLDPYFVISQHSNIYCTKKPDAFRTLTDSS